MSAWLLANTSLPPNPCLWGGICPWKTSESDATGHQRRDAVIAREWMCSGRGKKCYIAWYKRMQLLETEGSSHNETAEEILDDIICQIPERMSELLN